MEWKDLAKELLETNVFNKQILDHLKRDPNSHSVCDPNLVMDLRHQMVKRNSKLRNKASLRRDIMCEARRLVLSEEYEELAKEKDLGIVKKEINKFKQQLEIQRNELQKQNPITCCKSNARSHLNSKISTMPITQKKLELSIDEETFPQTMTSSHVVDTETVSCSEHLNSPNIGQMDNNNLNEASSDESEMEPITRQFLMKFTWRKWRNFINEQRLDKIKIRAPSKIGSKTSENIVDLKVPNEKQILKSALKKWKNYVYREKWMKLKVKKLKIMDSDEEHNTQEENITLKECDFNTKNCIMKSALQNCKKLNAIQTENCNLDNQVESVKLQYNIKLLKKFWKSWRAFNNDKKVRKIMEQEKKSREEKISAFLKTLQEQKTIMNCEVKEHTVTKSKSETSVLEKKTDLSSSCSEFQLCRSKNTFHRKSKSEVVAKLPNVMCDKTSPFHHRFQAQQQIIANQKMKLEEQKKLIEEMRLEKFQKELKESAKQAQANLIETLSLSNQKERGGSVTLPLTRPKLNCIAPPRFLAKMTERAQDRERRWQMLKEKKQKIEEEKLRKIEEEKEEFKQQVENEKRRKIEELREKRRLEQDIEMRKIKEKQRMSSLMLKAKEHYRKKLMKKYGIMRLKQLVVIRAEQMLVVSAYFNRRTLLKHFYVWKMYVKEVMKQKLEEVVDCYHMQLMRKGMQGFFLEHEDYIRNRQVAYDFFEFQLQKRIFCAWHTYTCVQHLERNIRLDEAHKHYKRGLLIKSLKHWKRLPSIMQEEREKEERKSFWRKKVRDLLPDYSPAALEEAF